MKQLRYWLREKSFVAFVVGGVLLLALAGSTIYLVKQKASDLVADSNLDQSSQERDVSDKSSDTINQKDSGEARSLSSSEPEINDDDVQSDDERGSVVVIASADELPQTGGSLNSVKMITILTITYGFSYLGQFLFRRI